MIKEGVVKIGETPCVLTGKPCVCVSGNNKCACESEPIADKDNGCKIASLKTLGESVTDK